MVWMIVVGRVGGRGTMRWNRRWQVILLRQKRRREGERHHRVERYDLRRQVGGLDSMPILGALGVS